MTPDVFWSFANAFISQSLGVGIVLLLVDQWRFSAGTMRRALLVLIPALWAGMIFCFLFLDKNSANLLVGLWDIASLALVPILAPWRKGRLLFIISTAYSMVFICIFLSSLTARLPPPVYLLARLLASALFLLWVAKWFRPSLKNVLCAPISMWYRLSALPVLMSVLCFQSMIFFYLNGRDTIPWGGITAGFALTLFVGVWLPLCVYIVFYRFFQVLDRHFYTQRSTARLDTQVTAAQKVLDGQLAAQSWDEAFYDAHSMLLDALEEKLHRGDMAGALGDLEEFSKCPRDIGGGEIRRYTGQSMVDAVLNFYTGRAQREGVDFRPTIHLPAKPTFESEGLAVVLSNALENAFSAALATGAGAPRRVLILGDSTGDQFFLEVRNTYAGEVCFDTATGRPVTREEGHGYGTRSMEAFATAHKGTIRFDADGSEFRLRMLI